VGALLYVQSFQPKMIIELSIFAIEVICKLFSNITKLSYFPSKWKKSINIIRPKPTTEFRNTFEHREYSTYYKHSMVSSLMVLCRKLGSFCLCIHS